MILKLLFLLTITFFFSIEKSKAQKGNSIPEINSEKKSSVFLFLKTYRRDCLKGDSLIVSEIFKVAKHELKTRKFNLLETFEDEVQDRHRRYVIDVSIESIHGIYQTLDSAIFERNNLIYPNENKLVLK
ncbi:hypothetical protein [Flammeovirga kamogawensis]|uniref:Uncharacterized protein n=1 Tax=Flammeovirga kamogawensis TaxID=373891 RepID=A0ABX8GVT0_9BACT|nr:hypothetical protein [Flammeovirga kamogawensis]MBB6461139.1 hypothetical protein [Flammeovirga kamogawensis]QWG07705.1 hypothetical protein KM029_01845 [Flammeovirga kamogawensis]TRX69513.1 hypothetical protein EO216_15780 [Flammeovirga kamogawensis]